MPLTEHIALISLTDELTADDLMAVTAAVQKQLTRDFLPIWGVAATVDAFAELAAIPSDYRPVVVFGDSNELAGRLDVATGDESAARPADQFDAERLQGLHMNAFTRQPFALVPACESWTLGVSHEVLELLTNPWGNALRAAAHPLDPSMRVNYVLGVSDPCLASWYPVNGVPVADFYTPRYFDPVHTGARYSFTGEIEFPQQILEGGYASWIDPRDSMLYLLEAGADEPELLLGREELARSGASLRTLVAGHPRTPRLPTGALRPSRSIASSGMFEGVEHVSEGWALAMAETLASLAAEPARPS